MRPWLPLTLLAACHSASVKGSGVTKFDVRHPSAFTGLDVSDGISVSLGVAPAAKNGAQVAVRTDDNLVPLVKTDVVDGRLLVYIDHHASVEAVQPVTVEMVLPALSAISAHGGAHVKAIMLQGDSFSISASGGASTEASGEVASVQVEGSGGAVLDLGSLHAQKVAVSLSGGSHAEVSAAAAVAGEASGGSTLVVRGSPASRSVSNSGGSSVTFP